MATFVIAADTHYQPAWHDTLKRFADEIAALAPDCFIVAGDVGEGVDGFDQMLSLFQVINCPRLVLAGNHDLWVYPQDVKRGITSESLWTDILPRLTRERGAIWLEDTVWARDELAVCGTIGWYDYSARDLSIQMSMEEYAANKGMYMMDAWRMPWTRSDIAFAHEVGETFSARLRALDDDPSIQAILAVTHVPAFEEGMVRKPGDVRWNVSNAYFGNLTLGKRIAASRKVRHVVSGHTHVGVQATVQGAGGQIAMQVIAADYGHPAYVIVEMPPKEYSSP